MKPSKSKSAPATVRCAVYTRKSTEEGLDKEFNSLDAQREAGEAFVKSQQHEGWVCLPDRYDDGGFTGGNMDRPALKKLMTDVEEGRVDCVVVYKVDRLSRSLLDFARMMGTFDKRRVSFASVTQQFNTASSMGRLVLNVLLSFAQFEREIISERTRDKIAAARRKGKWSGGKPLLGYDVDPQRTKLVVNEHEAEQVREIFMLFLERRSLAATIRELDRRGWVTKRWNTRGGRESGGRRFCKPGLHRLLTNVTYVGQLRYRDEVHRGEHAGIVEPSAWNAVQDLLHRNGRSGGALERNRHGALLRGLLRCAACEAAMTHAYTSKHGRKLYRYYVCSNAQKRGWHACPTKSLPAGEIERFVVEQVRRIGSDPTLVQATIRASEEQRAASLESQRRELARLENEARKWRRVAASLASPTDADGSARLREAEERMEDAETRIAEIRRRMETLASERLNEAEAASVLAQFDPVWNALMPREQCRLFHLLLARVDYDGRAGKLTLDFHPAGIRSLAEHSLKEAL
jgi:site-specific DNA recombinase